MTSATDDTAPAWEPPWTFEERLKFALVPVPLYMRYRIAKERRRGEAEIALLPFLADPARVSLDIGANKGVYAWLLRDCSRSVHAFEPNPKMFRFLRRIAGDSVHVSQVALSNRSGSATLRVPRHRRGGFSNQGASLSDVKVADDFMGIEIEAKRVDDLGVENVGFIKIDVEGFEQAVLEGARETIARVAAGAIAQKILSYDNVSITTYVERIHDIEVPELKDLPSMESIESTPTRCPHPETAAQMEARILEARNSGDSVGGSIRCRVNGMPVGWGAPVFDRIEADLAKAMLSLPATKGFEIGSGFDGTFLKGSEHNDLFENRDGKVHTQSNRSGGVQGGISNGEELYFRVGFKPTATILKPQQTVDEGGKDTELIGRGRHDPCVLPRAVPIVEAMAALVLVEHRMMHHAQCESFSFQQ